MPLSGWERRESETQCWGEGGQSDVPPMLTMFSRQQKRIPPGSLCKRSNTISKSHSQPQTRYCPAPSNSTQCGLWAFKMIFPLLFFLFFIEDAGIIVQVCDLLMKDSQAIYVN